ncbi:MAG: TraR/DksA family transcriptional regulator [Pirellulaceae bacterium]
MSRKEALASMRAILVNRRDAIRAALKGDISALRELALASGDIADFALDASHEEVTSQMAEVESQELAHIEGALLRINEGGYGDCEDCEKPIPLARLEALPYATLCIKCQIKSEKTDRRDWSYSIGDAYDAI